MANDAISDLTDRQARALIAAAEQRGFEREPHLIWWRYDEALHVDAEAALQFLQERDPEAIPGALTAADPLPAWVAVERIANERCGINFSHTRPLIESAVKRGLMDWESRDEGRFSSREWGAALKAIGLLWDNDPEALREILGDHVTVALLPETAVSPCPSVCDHGWVRHKFAGELPLEPRDFSYDGPF